MNEAADTHAGPGIPAEQWAGLAAQYMRDSEYWRRRASAAEARLSAEDQIAVGKDVSGGDYHPVDVERRGALLESAERERARGDAWCETACLHARNEHYWRDRCQQAEASIPDAADYPLAEHDPAAALHPDMLPLRSAAEERAQLIRAVRDVSWHMRSARYWRGRAGADPQPVEATQAQTITAPE